MYVQQVRQGTFGMKGYQHLSKLAVSIHQDIHPNIVLNMPQELLYLKKAVLPMMLMKELLRLLQLRRKLAVVYITRYIRI